MLTLIGLLRLIHLDSRIIQDGFGLLTKWLTGELFFRTIAVQ